MDLMDFMDTSDVIPFFVEPVDFTLYEHLTIAVELCPVVR